MASNGGKRRGLLITGGILSIVAGIFQIIEGWVMANFFYDRPWFFWWPLLQSTLDVWREHIEDCAMVPEVTPLPIWHIVLGGLFLVMGIIAIAGGVSAIRRKSFGMSLAGAICILPSMHLGILAVIFVTVGKKEFEVEQ